MTGWNLPPGCTTRHIDEAMGCEAVCECCGHNVDSCICPECPYCSAVGDVSCYTAGHDDTVHNKIVKLEYNTAQLIGQTRCKIEDLKQQIADHELYITTLEIDDAQRRKWERRDRVADMIDGYDRDDLGESPDF